MNQINRIARSVGQGTGSIINTFTDSMMMGKGSSSNRNAAGGGHERTNSNQSNQNSDYGDSLVSSEPLKLGNHLKTDQDIVNYWEQCCKSVPISYRNDKIGSHLRENEHLLFKLDSVDMWCHVKIFMVQGKYNIDAIMDLKIERQMTMRDL